MRKRFDKESGAIIFQHTKDELRQGEVARETEKLKRTVKVLCKMMNISEEELEKALAEGVESDG